MSFLRMISPSKAAAKATGMGSSLTLILMERSCSDFFTVCAWSVSDSSALGT